MALNASSIKLHKICNNVKYLHIHYYGMLIAYWYQ